MTLLDECKQLMYYRSKIKDLKIMEEETKTKIISYLKNHNQGGVIFKYNGKQVTLMVEPTTPKRSISQKERVKRVHDVLVDAGVSNIESTTQKIINGLKQVTLKDKPSKEKIRFKVSKI